MLKSPIRLLALAAAVCCTPAMSKNCSADGGLSYLGATANQSRSVWLSSTTPGSFTLQAAQGNQTVDQWTPGRRGLHVSLSPVVSNGNGGTHKLLDSTGCLLDTQNQKGGINFPPTIHLPPTLPPFIKPPGGLMPSVPGAVKPPIGTLPPTGLMPTVPGGVTPPIGTLPPVTGITPEVPIAVKPPIGTLPPTGLMPTVPGGVTPPIGTLPPGEVSGSVDGRAVGVARNASVAPCPPGLTADGRVLDCADRQPQASVNGAASTAVPITPGRDLVEESLWNVWADLGHIDSSDRRNNLDLDGLSGNLTMGVDRRLNNDLVVGAMVSAESSRTSGFDGTWGLETRGGSVGPYAAYRLSPQWALDASLTWGLLNSDNRIDVLNGSYQTQRYSGVFNATGQYQLDDEINLRPRLSLSYSHFRNDAYEMNGIVEGIPVSLTVAESHFNYGSTEAVCEFNKTFHRAGGTVVVPYIELGVRYDFERPNGGQVLTGNLSMADTSPWVGSVRAGARALIGRSTFIEPSFGYMSLGQQGLDVWAARVYLTHAY